MMLGTVQLGMPYGIANAHGQPNYAEARAILHTAWEAGVRWLDTAAGYGESEAVLGRALAELGLRDRMGVVTKLRWLDDIASDPAAARALITQSVRESRDRLGLETIPICLFHREEDVAQLPELLALREQGWIGAAGCSVMTPEAMARMLESPGLAAIQAPVSVLDRRFARAGLLQAAADRGIPVFARSVYVQGLVLLAEDRIPPFLSELVPVLRALRDLAAEADLSLGEMALRAVLAEPGVQCVVVGAETEAQVRESAAYAARGPLPPDLAAAVRAVVPILPDRLVMPHYWKDRGPSTP